MTLLMTSSHREMMLHHDDVTLFILAGDQSFIRTLFFSYSSAIFNKNMMYVTDLSLNPLSTGGLSKITSFMSSLIGGPIKILPQFSH